MKIIFLDIDGVMNNDLWHNSKDFRNLFLDDEDNRPYIYYDPRCVSLLNEITSETGAGIVMSSTHRKYYDSLDDIKKVFKQVGIKGELIDITPTIVYKNLGESVPRGVEIKNWIEKNEELLGVKYYMYKDYVILDDDSDMLYNQRNNFFWVDRFAGLTNNIAYKVINFLNS